MGWNRNFVHGRCTLNETINIRLVTERCFQGLRERGVRFDEKRPRNWIFRFHGGKEFSTMRAKVGDNSWFRQEHREK